MTTSFLRILSPILFAGLASMTLVLDTHARVFVGTNATWRYFKSTREASTPTNAWRELDFDDSPWLVGAAPFHFGTNALGGDDNLIEGTILSDMRSNYTCLFLRQCFVLPDTNNVRGLWLNAWLDDGLAIWINGQAARNPISVSGLAYTNTATTTREGYTRNALSLSNVVWLLRPGTNVLCLQAFNRNLTDDDFRIDVQLAEAPPTFALATNTYTVREDAAEVEVRVVRAGALDAGATIDYASTNGSAAAGLDYEATAGTLFFEEGQTEQPIPLRIFNDALIEDTENFHLKLSNPGGGATLGSPSTGTVQIAEAQAPPVPHHFRGITLGPDQTATLGLDGSALRMFNLTGTISNQFREMFDLYAVDASTSLVDWTRLALLLRTNNNPNPVLFQDTHAAGLDHRFYRTSTNHLLTGFSKPTGPFAVGTIDRVMIDPTRTNLYRYSPPTNSFMVTFWYPADPPPAGMLPAPAWDPRLAADPRTYEGHMDVQWALVCPKLVGHRFGGVPPAAAMGNYPVILWSHGYGAFRKLSSHAQEELASHGYVVVAMDHTECTATEFPDGRYLAGNYLGVPTRLQDLQFLLDMLADLNSGDPLFAGRLDSERIGIVGASWSGMVVETCRSDRRVKCAALWDATNVQLNSAGLQKPFIFVVGQTNLFYAQGQWLFSKTTNNAVFLQVRGADHITNTDAAWTAQVPWGRGPAQALDACFLWLFDTYLKGEAPPLPGNPEIYNVQRK